MFRWIPIHQEAIHKILESRDNESGFLTVLQDMEDQELKVIIWRNKDNALTRPIPIQVTGTAAARTTFGESRRQHSNRLCRR